MSEARFNSYYVPKKPEPIIDEFWGIFTVKPCFSQLFLEIFKHFFSFPQVQQQCSDKNFLKIAGKIANNTGEASFRLCMVECQFVLKKHRVGFLYYH